MKKFDIFLNALRNLKNRKTRTRLTVIGVVIGTCSILVMVSIGVGISKMVTSQYDTGSSLQKITVNNPNDVVYDDLAAMDGTSEKKELLFNDDAVSHFKKINHVTAVIPSTNMNEYATISRGKYNYSADIIAIDTSKMDVLGYSLSSGSFKSSTNPNVAYFGSQTVINFSDASGNLPSYKFDKSGKLSECELNLKKDLFTIRPKYGDEVQADGSQAAQSEATQTAQSALVAPQKITFGGELKEDNNVDWNMSYEIFVNMADAQKIIQQYNKLNNKKVDASSYTQMYVIIDDVKNVDDVKKIINDEGYPASSNDEELQDAKKMMKIVQIVLGALGAISMLVAAFGISNTMVMSVYERTKEIGVMKVLGCELADIKAMFLYEAGCIGLIGGTIGLIISYIISITANAVARHIMNGQFGSAETICVSSIPPWLAILGILFSVVVGVIAGMAPASRAVKTSALTAIHNE